MIDLSYCRPLSPIHCTMASEVCRLQSFKLAWGQEKVLQSVIVLRCTDQLCAVYRLKSRPGLSTFLCNVIE